MYFAPVCGLGLAVPGSGVSGVYDPADGGNGTKLRSSAKSVYAFNSSPSTAHSLAGSQ